MRGRLLGHYRVIDLVGTGGMGEVYRARDERLDRDVAVKVLPASAGEDPRRLARFELEAKALARLAHPNILTIFDFATDAAREPGGAPIAYAVTELLTGETLRARLARERLPHARAVEVAIEIGRGLQAAHEQGLVHRDIKPENVFLTADGRVKILDFGVARLVAADLAATATAATQAGVLVGTVGYMAPEQLRGLPLDHRADLFALGCVLFEMLTGRRPFEGATPIDTMSAVLHEQPPALVGAAGAVPPGLQRIVERCLQKQPGQRFASAADLVRALESLRTPAADGRALPTPAPVLAERPSIAVLPFLDLAAAHDQEYFCDGLAEELTSRLTHLRGLRVVSRTSAFAFKGKVSDVREIGRQLSVRTLLEGSVQRAGDRVRVRVQLTDATDGCQVWSERFDRPAGDIFAVEDEIAQAVVSVLQVTLLGTAEERAVRGRVADPIAHDLYLQGRFHAVRRSAEGLAEAMRCFERAVQIDPAYAAAHAGIAECHTVIGFLGLKAPAEVLPLAKSAAERALALDPDLVEAHAVLGHELGMFEWQWEEAERHFRRGLELNPGYALTRVWYSHLLCVSGRFDEAIAQMERACDSDPLAPNVQMTLGLALYSARDYSAAIDRYLKVLAMSPSFSFVRLHLGRAYLAAGNAEAALEQLEIVAPAFPMALGMVAAVARMLGRHERAERAMADLEETARTRYVSPLSRAIAHRGNDEASLAWFTRAVDEHDANFALMNTDPGADFLRGDVRFQALLDRLGLPKLERRTR